MSSHIVASSARASSAARSRALMLGVSVATLLLASAPVSAQTSTWANIALGNWGAPASWTNNTVPNAAGATAIFNAPGAGVSLGVDLTGGPFTVGTLSLRNPVSGGFNFQGGTLAMNRAGGASIVVETENFVPDFFAGSALRLDANTRVNTLNATSVFNVVGNVSGVGSLQKNGPGVMVMQGVGTYAGGTRVSGGRLTIAGGSALADGGSVRVDAAGTLQVDATETIGVLVNAGTVNVADGQSLVAPTISNTGAGTINIGVGSTMQGTGNTLNNAAVINVATNGAVTDAGAVNNLAAGVINFNGPGGTATLSSGTNVITNAGAINVNSGGVNVTGNVRNHTAGTITLAAGAGTVNVTGNVRNQDNATITVNGGSLAVTGTLTNVSAAAAGIQVAAGRTLSAAAISNAAGATIDNSGAVNAQTGNIDNSGTITNGVGAVVQTLALDVINRNGGVITNNGVVNGQRNVVNQAGGLITNNSPGVVRAMTGFVRNDGTITNAAGATVDALTNVVINGATGVLNNSGAISGQTGFRNLAGGVLNNLAAGAQAGAVTGDFINAGTINNNVAGAQVGAQAGRFINQATGVANNSGILGAQGDAINLAGGTINNFAGGQYGSFGGNVINAGTIANAAGATVQAQAFDIINRNGGVITNNGDVTAQRNVVNQAGGTITNNAGAVVTATAGSVVNSGQITNAAGATVRALALDIINSGVITNNGAVTAQRNVVNQAGGTITNNGFGSVAAVTGNVVNSGTINNTAAGTILQSQTLDIINRNGGVITNSGTVSGQRNVVNQAGGTITNNAGGTVVAQTGNIDNAGQITNAAGASVSTLTLDVVNRNGGVITNDGNVFGQRNVVNQAGGTINNNAGAQVSAVTGDVNNAGAINNAAGATVQSTAADIVNSGTITNAGGNVTAQVGITNLAGGLIANTAVGSFVTAVSGNIDNSGTITNVGGSAVRALALDIVNRAGGGITNNGGVVTAGRNVSNAGTINNNGLGNVSAGVDVINRNGGVINNIFNFVATRNFINQAGGTVNNNAVGGGAVSATNGDIINAGLFNTAATATTQTVTGDFINQAGGMVMNNGAMNIQSNIVNLAGGTINTLATGVTTAIAGNIVNSGQMTNAPGGVIQTQTLDIINRNGGVFSSNGTVVSQRNLINQAGGTINNTSIMTANTGNVSNAGTIGNGAGGTLRALVGQVLNAASGTITNAGTLSGATGVVNAGTLNTTGTVINGLTNVGVVNASGFIFGGVTNRGAFTVTGLLNNAGGAFNNFSPGRLVVNAGQTFFNISTLTSTSNALAEAVLVNAGSTLAANVAINNAAGRMRNLGTLTAPQVANAGILTTSGTLAAAASFTNTGTTNGSGTLNTPLATNSGTFNVVGNLGGATTVFNNTGTGRLSLVGGNFGTIGTFNNAGIVQSTSGVARTLTTPTFNNLGSGAITMQNGSVADQLTLTGAYAGSGGSRILLDADLSKNDASKRGDLLVVNGAASGSSTLAFNFVNGQRVAFDTPINVFRVAPGSGIAVNEGQIESAGFLKYFLKQSAPGSGLFQIVSQFNAAPVLGVASGISSMVTSLQAGFHQPNSAIIARPDSCAPNQIMGGPFIRVNGGDTKISSVSSVSGAGVTGTGTASSNSTFKGIQGGVDFGVCNIQGADWNLHIGGMGGFVEVESKSASVTVDPVGGRQVVNTTAKVEVPFFGVYTFVTKGPFTFEINVRKDYYRTKVSSFGDITYVAPGTKVRGDGLNFNLAASYRFAIGERAYIEPQVGVSKGQVNFNNLQFATAGTDVMNFNRSDSVLGRIGFNAGYIFQATEQLYLVPFVHASVWREFAGATRAQAVIGAAGQVFEVQTDRVGTFGQLGAGVQFKVQNTPFLGFLRGDFRFGNNINGKAVNAGLRMQF